MRRAVKSAFRKAGSLTRAACDLAAGERRGFSLKDGALSHGKGAAVYEGSAGKYILPSGVEPELFCGGVRGRTDVRLPDRRRRVRFGGRSV